MRLFFAVFFLALALTSLTGGTYHVWFPRSTSLPANVLWKTTVVSLEERHFYSGMTPGYLAGHQALVDALGSLHQGLEIVPSAKARRGGRISGRPNVDRSHTLAARVKQVS